MSPRRIRFSVAREQAAAVVRSVLSLYPKDGDTEALVDFYATREILEEAMLQEGCLAAELCVPADGAGPLVVTALWRDVAAYDAWVANPYRAANAEDLAALVEGGFGAGARGSLYEIVLSAPS
jgi:quinol monooxygenase YgiN